MRNVLRQADGKLQCLWVPERSLLHQPIINLL